MTNWYLNFTETSELVDDKYKTQISEIKTGWIGEQPEPFFDGLSDFSETVTSAAMVF